MDVIHRIVELSNENEVEIIKIRRDIHENPELSFQEYRTQERIIDYLDNLGINYEKVAGTGVVAVIEGDQPGKTIMLRADIDALPLLEESEVDYASKNEGKMHACGHDVHTANLMGTLHILNECRDVIKGRVKFLFQPAEEAGGGGREVVKEGVLEDVDFALGMHVNPDTEGSIKITPGAVTAYSDGFEIKVLGQNAHSSKPQDGVDAIYIATNILNALYSLTFRYVDPMEVSTFNIGTIEGGTAGNIIANEVLFKGMMRNLDKKTRDTVRDRIESTARGVAQALGGDIEFFFKEGYPSVFNDEKLTKLGINLLLNNYGTILSDINASTSQTAEGLISTDELPKLGAEDFGFYAQQVPSLFLWFGTGDIAPLHSKNFNINEDYLKVMTRLMSLLTIEFLNELGGN